MLSTVTEPQTQDPVLPADLVFPCASWITIPVAMALFRLGAGDNSFGLPSFPLVLGFLLGLVGVVMAIVGLIGAASHPALGNPDAHGHRFAVFGVLSNAAALAILLVALVLSS